MQEPDWNGMLAEFLARDSTTPIRRDALRRILEIDPEREPTKHLLPVDEAGIKLELLRTLERYWEDHFPSLSGEPRDRYKPLHQVVVATVMMMDINGAREMEKLSLSPLYREPIISVFLKELNVMPCFIKKGKCPSAYLLIPQ